MESSDHEGGRHAGRLQTMKTTLDSISSETLVAGLDGGGTLTKVVVADLRGRIVLCFQVDSINHYGTGMTKTQKVFKTIADRLLVALGCLPSVLFVGNSALSGRAEDAQVQELTQGVFGSSKVVFHSDVYVALLGSTLGRAGAVLVAGTGSMACGIDPSGHYHTLGGWGQTLGDEGSGYFIGLEGIKSAIRGYEGLMPPTALTERLMRYFGLCDLTELIDRIYTPPAEKQVIAAFAVEVAEAALDGDQVATQLLKEAAVWLYRLALTMARRCETTQLGYVGSVLGQNTFIRSQLTLQLASHGITLVKPHFPPEIGAIIGAFQEKGLTITPQIMDNLSTYSPL